MSREARTRVGLVDSGSEVPALVVRVRSVSGLAASFGVITGLAVCDGLARAKFRFRDNRQTEFDAGCIYFLIFGCCFTSGMVQVV